MSTKRKPAKFIYTPPPELFMTALEQQRYFEEEKRRWIEGYKGLCGMHYYHLTQNILKTGDGHVMRPNYREDDEHVFKFLMEMFDKGEDGLWLAGRGFGKSLILATILSYNIRVWPGCVQAMTSADMDRIGKFFNQKLDFSITGIDPRISGKRNKFNNTKEGYERGYSIPSRDVYGNPIFAQTDIYGRETSKTEKSPSNLSGLRGKFIAIDEAALHQRLKQTRETSIEILKENGVRIGSILMTGTVEDGASQDSVMQLNYLTDNHKALNLRIQFTPCYHGKYLRQDGTSDHDRFIREYNEECEKLDKLEDKSSLLIYQKNNPMTLNDALRFSLKGALPSEVYAQASVQKDYLMNNPPQIRKCILKTGRSSSSENGVDIELSNEGKIKISELPIKGELYIAGTDPIQAENISSTDGSQLVLTIFRVSTRKIVASYAERTAYSDILARNTILLCDLYNHAVNMIESNAGNVLIGKIKEAGRADLMAKQPRKNNLHVKGAKGIATYGVRVTSSERAKNISFDLIVKYFLENSDLVDHVEYLDDLQNYVTGNSDYIDSMQCVLIYEREIAGKQRTDIEKQEYVEVPVWQGGKFVMYKKPVTSKEQE